MDRLVILELTIFLSLFFLPLAYGELDRSNELKQEGLIVSFGNCTYLGGVLSGPQLINLTGNTVDSKRKLVAQFGFNLSWLDITNHGITSESAILLADNYVGPSMRNATENDIWVVMSAGVQLFLYERVVKKVPFRGRVCFVETTNGGIPRVVAIGMNFMNVFTHGDPVDSESDFMRDLRPDSEMNVLIRQNLGNFTPDVQVTAKFTRMFARCNIGPWDMGGIGSMFRPFKTPTPLVYDIDHPLILSHDEVIEDMFQALGIKKINATT